MQRGWGGARAASGRWPHGASLLPFFWPHRPPPPQQQVAASAVRSSSGALTHLVDAHGLPLDAMATYRYDPNLGGWVVSQPAAAANSYVSPMSTTTAMTTNSSGSLSAAGTSLYRSVASFVSGIVRALEEARAITAMATPPLCRLLGWGQQLWLRAQ